MAESVTWIDPGNVSYPFDGSSFYLAISGRQGFFAPPTSIIEQETPLKPGAALRLVKITSRPLKLPLLVKCASESQLATTRRTLRFALNPMRGSGILQVTAADGVVRQMHAFCDGGMEGDETLAYRPLSAILFPLSFRAVDPFWYDVNNNTTVYTTFGGAVNVTNNGDQDARPVWTLTGPFTNATLVNNTTGKSLTLTGVNILTGHFLVIDTRLTNQSASGGTIKDDTGASRFSALGATSSLWSLVPGVNSFTITLTGTTGATAVQLDFKQAYDGC